MLLLLVVVVLLLLLLMLAAAVHIYVTCHGEPFDGIHRCIDTLSLITEIMYSLWHIIEDAFDAFIMHPIEWI